MLNGFSRTELLLGEGAMQALAQAHVAVFGIGGVGGHAAEALARCGVGALTLVDHDKVSLTNLNRQIVALTSTIGRYKAEAMAERIADINPDCRVTARVCFYLPDTADEIDLAQFDYIVDAVDNVTAKLLLAERAQAAGVPTISSMGTANKLDPTLLRVTDINKTENCPLAKIIRKECRKRGIRKLKVVYSPEKAHPPSAEAQAAYLAEAAAGDPAARDKFGRAGVPGTVPFVPAAAGLLLASEVVKDLVTPKE